MSALGDMLKNVDDDYLTGLCNKGTVKRAYKDLGQETPVTEWQGEEAKVTLKEETCRIRLPLGESECSCPSRSICRHIVTAILWLKQEGEGAADESGADGEEAAAEPVTEAQDGEVPKEKVPDIKEPPKPLEEILNIPLDRLKRVCKGKKYQNFLARMRAGEIPDMEESSIVTITLPWEKATVKLLEPFDYSTCSCHSKELCSHKAQAVLIYQMKKGRISFKDLEVVQETENIWEEAQVKQACESVCEAVIHQICTGLSRQSPEAAKSLERLAVITHRAGLPALESLLRGAAAEYEQYFSRSAAFRSDLLFLRLLKIYDRARLLMQADSQEAIRPLAGSFRDSYELTGRLHLLGMGGRTFESKTGYEGEIYYFLEPEKKKWYTWTDARPVFYEGVRRRPPASSDNAAAPWGLNCNREQLQSLEFELRDAKAASGGRLSVSQETKGEAMGRRELTADGVPEMVCWDFKELLLKNFAGQSDGQEAGNRAAGRREKLTLAGAVRWGEADFDPVQQRFSWSLYDKQDRELFIALTYSKREKLTIKLLERLVERLKKNPPEAIIFFGSLYLDEEGRMCLYPIEIFQKEAGEILHALDDKAGADKPLSRKEEGFYPEAISPMEQYRKEAADALTDLFVSGIYSVQEGMIEQLSALSMEGEQLGLHRAGEGFGVISKLLQEKRHKIEFTPEPVLETAGYLYRYLEACREKLSCDRALVSMGAV